MGSGRSLHEELNRSASQRLGGEDELTVPVVQALHGQASGVPDLTLGGEADHLVASEVDEGRHLGPGPLLRDRPPEAEPGGVPHATPGVADGERCEGPPQCLCHRDRLTAQAVGRDLERRSAARRPPGGPPS